MIAKKYFRDRGCNRTIVAMSGLLRLFARIQGTAPLQVMQFCGDAMRDRPDNCGMLIIGGGPV
jgi:hypothetical protein